MKLSHSKVELADKCLYAYDLKYNKRLPQEPSDALVGGIFFHEMADVYTKDPSLDVDNLIHIKSGEIPVRISADIIPVFKRWVELYTESKSDICISEISLAFDEFGVSCDWKESFVRGRIDKLEYSIKDGIPIDIKITDWKTNRNIPTADQFIEQTFQLQTYGWLVWNYLVEKYELTDFYPDILIGNEYVRYNTRRDFLLTPDDYIPIQQIYVSKADWLSKVEEYPAMVNTWCNFCGYKGLCPKFQNIDTSPYFIDSPDDAMSLSERVYATEMWLKDAKKVLKNLHSEYGALNAGDKVFRNNISTTKTINDIDAVIDSLIGMGIPKDEILSIRKINTTDITRLAKKYKVNINGDLDPYITKKDTQRFGFYKKESDG